MRFAICAQRADKDLTECEFNHTEPVHFGCTSLKSRGMGNRMTFQTPSCYG
jgi:hypothetical protein